MVLTEDYENEEETSWFGIKEKVMFVPLWKWLLKYDKIFFLQYPEIISPEQEINYLYRKRWKEPDYKKDATQDYMREYEEFS